MPVSQEVFVINEPLNLEERRRTTSSGTKSRFTISVRSNPLIINLSEINLGKGPAEALRKAISDGIKAITAVASPGTILRRKYDASALARGARHAVKRYSGGRTGTKPPGQSDRLFNDSTRLADGVYVMQNQKEGAWTVNVPANRLDPSTFKDQGTFVGMVRRLQQLVPVFQNPLAHPDVKRAIETSIDQMFTVATDTNYKSRLALIKTGLQTLKAVSNFVDTVLR